MYIYIYIHTYIHMYIIYTRKYTYIHIYIYIHVYVTTQHVPSPWNKILVFCVSLGSARAGACSRFQDPVCNPFGSPGFLGWVALEIGLGSISRFIEGILRVSYNVLEVWFGTHFGDIWGLFS